MEEFWSQTVQEESGIRYFKSLREKKPLKFYIQKKHPPKMKEK